MNGMHGGGRGERRVLVVGINYRPELTGIGPYTAGLAEHLAARGDHVTVITGLPHYPGWRLAGITNRSLIGHEMIDGVRVIRAAHYVPARQTALRRAMYEGTFGLTGLLAALDVERPDAIVGVVPSLSGGILARLTASRLGVPYGLLFQDLMGPAARQSGIAGGGTVARATTAAETWAIRQAAAIGVVATSFVPYVASLGVPAERISHVPNWTRPIEALMTVAETRARFGWPEGGQIVLHAGNIGLKQGLEQVVEAARIAASRADPVRFVFSGGGNQEAAIRTAAAGLANVEFLGVQPNAIHASLLDAADVLLLSERPAQLDMSLPSKLTSYFAAGKPIVAAVARNGGSASEVERSGAGLVVPAGQPAALLAAMERLRTDDVLAARLSASGRAYAAVETAPDVCLARSAAFVDAIARRSAAAPGEPATSTMEPAA